MGKGYFDVASHLLVEFLKPLKAGARNCQFSVVENGLPYDTELVSAEVTSHDVIRLWVESVSIKDGEQLKPPVISVHYEMSTEEIDARLNRR